jgi:hypothetical protein
MVEVTQGRGFWPFRRPAASQTQGWRCSWSEQGISIERVAEDGRRGGAVLSLDGLLTQLADEGLVIERDGNFLFAWEAFYAALESPDYGDLARLLGTPRLTEARIALRSQNSLTDQNFSISVSAWRDAAGRDLLPSLVGPVMKHDGVVELMRPKQWQLLNAVLAFSQRGTSERTDIYHRSSWGRIRALAVDASADLDQFLRRSVVLTPERLEIGLRKSEHVGDDNVIEIEPGFAGAPESWLDRFDRAPAVQDRYDITTEEGIVQVLISPTVRTVLEEIKRLPGRRVAGARAQAFIVNPYATLGDDAKDVIVESQFEEARKAAGLSYERFVPVSERDAAGCLTRIGILVETASETGPSSSETHWLTDAELTEFISKVENALARNHQLVAWRGFDLELQGDTHEHLSTLKAARDERQRPQTVITYEQIHNLDRYSSRVEAIGTEKVYYSPYIARKRDDEGWFPDNILPVIKYQAEGEEDPVGIPVNPELLGELRRAVEDAQALGRERVDVPWLPTPVALEEAKDICKAFEAVYRDVRSGGFEPEKTGVRPADRQKKNLVVRANIQSLDYEERRREALEAIPSAPVVPGGLRPDCTLLPHQRSGLAWLQHLFVSRDEYHVRGAVLADDMGLGKTLQLLALMAWLVEQDAGIKPMLVVAPVSLLENWKEEMDKFLTPGTLPILIAYGEGLSPLRVPQASIDERLRTEDGLVKFLRPGWLGSARVVLTTYETLRDLEFSFAAQRWSLMVCDEAQRIKNPAAMVTRAAKKQNVGFKVACTGTPVENTLADLWCLFDFVQPGLLGALNEFGKRYRRPIEAKTEEERARVGELRERIAPQILRRTKAEVASDLPSKVVVEECRRLPISGDQRALYAKAIEEFRRPEASMDSRFKNHLGLLHYLRLICTDPRGYGAPSDTPEALAPYRLKAPKLDWLLKRLGVIKAQGEKVIVFCEFRHIQRLLQHYIKEVYGYRADIINGDTTASASHSASRQKRLRAFQAEAGFGVIILSPLAVGFGVNIQAANHVVHYTRTWNPAKEDQATDRAYRIGQKKDVYVYYPVVVAEDFSTFDVKLDELLTIKRDLADDMLNGSGDVTVGDFNIADVVIDAKGKIEEVSRARTLPVEGAPVAIAPPVEPHPSVAAAGALSYTAPASSQRKERYDWLDEFPPGGVRQFFEHLSEYGVVTEVEVAAMLGGQRALRRFALDFDAFAAKAPYKIRIDVVAGVKRYVRGATLP